MRFAMLAAAFGAGCLVVPAHAAEIIQHDNELFMNGLLKFNPLLGTLNSVTLKIDVNKSNYNQLYSTTGEAGNYAVSWVSHGTWLLDNPATGLLSVALTSSGSTIVPVFRGAVLATGDFSIFNVTGSQTFSLNTAGFVGPPGSGITLDGAYQGMYLQDASDTSFTLPAGFAVRRRVGACGDGFNTGEDWCGTTNYTLTYDYTPNATPGVPEPATWALLMLGFGGMGAAMRRRAQRLLIA